MKNIHRISILTSLVSAAALSFSSVAAAQTTTQQRATSTGSISTQEQLTVGEGTPTGALPPPRSDNDPRPVTSAPVLPANGIVEQAGIGGATAYARAGVLELGGNIGFNAGSGATMLSISPTVGWFFADNLQISGIFSYRYANISGNDAHSLMILAEPSVHIPFSRNFFGFAGLGMGLGYTDTSGAGFALAPRLGVNLAVGRSGILTPALQFTYSTNDVIQTQSGALLAVSMAFGANIGYTVMW